MTPVCVVVVVVNALLADREMRVIERRTCGGLIHHRDCIVLLIILGTSIICAQHVE